MKRVYALILIILMYIPSVLLSPAYAASHAKDDTVSEVAEVDDNKKKKEDQEDQEEEEPDCD